MIIIKKNLKCNLTTKQNYGLTVIEKKKHFTSIKQLF